MYYFPKNKIGCYNDTICGIGGKCEILSPEKTLWCNCPKLYDPLDNCKSYYYNYTGDTMHIIYLIVLIVLNLGLTAVIIKHIKSEFLIWNKNKFASPRPKNVIIVNLILCNICSVISGVLNLSHLSSANFILDNISGTLTLMCVIHMEYYLVVMITKSKRLGNLGFKWKLLSILIIVFGDVGSILGSIVGIVRDIYFPRNVTLTNINVFFLVIGLFVPILIGLYVYITGLREYAKMDTTTKSVVMLRNLIKLIIAITIYVVFVLLLILFLVYYFPGQIFDVITMNKFVGSALSYTQRVLFAVFIMLTKISNPDAPSRTSTDSSNKIKTTSTKSKEITAKKSTDNESGPTRGSDYKTSTTLSWST